MGAAFCSIPILQAEAALLERRSGVNRQAEGHVRFQSIAGLQRNEERFRCFPRIRRGDHLPEQLFALAFLRADRYAAPVVAGGQTGKHV